MQLPIFIVCPLFSCLFITICHNFIFWLKHFILILSKMNFFSTCTSPNYKFSILLYSILCCSGFLCVTSPHRNSKGGKCYAILFYFLQHLVQGWILIHSLRYSSIGHQLLYTYYMAVTMIKLCDKNITNGVLEMKTHQCSGSDKERSGQIW